jgi:lipopolysaccharide/colanic/teichoic acid biosynthesis glycosyltransferase
MNSIHPPEINNYKVNTKRIFDFIFSLLGLIVFFWLIAIVWVLAAYDTSSNGFFRQTRVGRFGKLFKVVKIRTMRNDINYQTNITQTHDPRITRLGSFFRRTKIDELPQLWNVLIGEMSFVGPRPDVPGYADNLEIKQRYLLLSVRPGITGPATLAYRKEESLLAKKTNPERYNDEIIYPDKVRINLEYIKNSRFRDDLYYIWKTIFS